MGAGPVVGGAGEFEWQHGVDDDDGDAARQGHVLSLERLTVDEESAAFLGESGGELVHDPALDAGVHVLSALAKEGHLARWQLDAGRGADRAGQRQFERRGRGQARGLRHVAADRQVDAAQWELRVQ